MFYTSSPIKRHTQKIISAIKSKRRCIGTVNKNSLVCISIIFQTIRIYIKNIISSQGCSKPGLRCVVKRNIRQNFRSERFIKCRSYFIKNNGSFTIRGASEGITLYKTVRSIVTSRPSAVNTLIASSAFFCPSSLMPLMV